MRIRNFPVSYTHLDVYKRQVYVLEVKGLKGGHSGGCIHLGRGNANKIAGRILYHLLKNGMDIRLIDITGGLKNNAIPRECTVAFASQQSYEELAQYIGQYETCLLYTSRCV